MCLDINVHDKKSENQLLAATAFKKSNVIGGVRFTLQNNPSWLGLRDEEMQTWKQLTNEQHKVWVGCRLQLRQLSNKATNVG